MHGRPAVPPGLLGMIILVALVEGIVAGRQADFCSPGTWSWHLSARSATTEARGCAVLCLGDSLMKQGVLPPVVASRLGQPVFNLAVIAAQPPASYYLYRHAVEAGARPRAIVVDFCPDLMAGGPSFNLRNWNEILSWADDFELARLARRPGLFVELALGRLLPSLRCRFEVREVILAALRGEAPAHRRSNRLYTRQWNQNRGGQFTPPNPQYHGEVGPEQQQMLLSGQFWCDKLNRLYIDRLLRLAARQGTRVYWVLTPFTPQLQKIRDESGAHDREVAFLREIQKQDPRLVVLDGRHAGYDWPFFLDPIHLNGPGALTLSADIAAEMARDAPTSSWIALPAFRERARDLPIEDVEQSRLALERDDRARR